MELELIETEASVGKYSADIYAKEIGTGKKVIIENQLEATDHDHLGKIITYAAGKDAEIVVWIVPKANEEHSNAIDWLNEHTDIGISFFLIEMELWSIDGSKPALHYNIIEQPNNWAKLTQKSNTLNETDKVKLQYWQEYYDIASNNEEFIKVFNPHKASADHWSVLATGSSKYFISLLVNTKKEGRIGIEISVSYDKELGQFFIDNTSKFEKALGLSGESYIAESSSGIRFFENNCNIKKNKDKWQEYVEWHMKKTLSMKKVLDSLDIPV